MSHVHKLIKTLDSFFFAQISATGFGCMRMVWGLTIFLWMLSMWQDVTFYYSTEGLIIPDFHHLLFRSEYRFTLLDIVTAPAGVWTLYILLLLAAFMTFVGYLPRFFTICTVVLFFSFQERNLLTLGGGDTTLRTIGLILAISPELRAFSVHRLRDKWKEWKIRKTLLPPLTMSVWPYRLLLWQAIIIYIYSGIEKSSGTMWLDGTAIEVFFHHPNFFRWSKDFGDLLTPLSSFVSYFTLLFEFVWLFLLIPRSTMERIPLLSYGSLKRGILACGVLFHVGIFVLSDVGIFPISMLTLYTGLLIEEDFAALRRKCNRKWKGSIALLYDGTCRLCLQSVFVLMLLDFLKRLNPVDFHTEESRKKIAPNLLFTELDKAMHIVDPNKRTEKGFDAFRFLCWHIPIFWITAPLLYIPGVPFFGRKLYARIAKRREHCDENGCRI